MLGFGFLLLLTTGSSAILDRDFLNFITNRYGHSIAQQMNRADLGGNGDGSFGGGHYPSKHRPVVLVHGLRNKAGYLWRTRKALQDNGWTAQRILATSYGTGDRGVWESMQETLKCQYVKQVRNFLLSTIHYYKSKIDVIAFSMGSPITRKAILGGRCVDTGEYIGEPLTHHIDIYLSVAGANQGSTLCNMPFGGVCSIGAGLNCMSSFMKDINAKIAYEGTHRYYIASTMDEIVGLYNGCGKKSAQFMGSQEFLVHGLNHEDTMFKAIDKQLQIMKLNP